MHMHMDSPSDYCKLTFLYKGPSTLFFMVIHIFFLLFTSSAQKNSPVLSYKKVKDAYQERFFFSSRKALSALKPFPCKK